MKALNSVSVINSNNRNSTVDIFRAIAIISVVLFHFNHLLPLGYIGVDLFFVISGLLVGSLLIKEFKKNDNINFFKFFLQRGFKIWPSYHIYIFIITVTTIYLNPERNFHFSSMYKYLFFYENYTGTCTIIWSLCVEEHFYVLLPLLFLVVINFIPNKYKIRSLFIFVCLIIIAGILSKFASYLFTNSKDTFSATHNRIDALAWGVLLGLLLSYFENRIKQASLLLFASGTILLITSIMLFGNWFYFDILLFHSILPFSFFLMIGGLYHIDMSSIKPLRFIAYYSYNWYLWHCATLSIISSYCGYSLESLIIYLISSFILAMITTILIEEPMLKIRVLFFSWMSAKRSVVHKSDNPFSFSFRSYK